jgi:catechol-2,3-dioxygenase
LSEARSFALIWDTDFERGKEPKNLAATLFRIILQVGDLDQAEGFYGTLLGDRGRRIPYASRHYIDCGPTILALVDVSGGQTTGVEPKPLPDNIYFAVSNLETIHKRARELGCLSHEDVHGASAGDIVKRPWGELSFYVHDPWGNGLCFVDENTLFTGRRE